MLRRLMLWIFLRPRIAVFLLGLRTEVISSLVQAVIFPMNLLLNLDLMACSAILLIRNTLECIKLKTPAEFSLRVFCLPPIDFTPVPW